MKAAGPVNAAPGAAPEPSGDPPAAPSAASLLPHLQSVRELQITLSQEGLDEAILRDGTTGTVEIVGADCAVALIEPLRGYPGLRFGWSEGRTMAYHEIEVFARRLEPAVAQIRQGKTSRLILAADLEEFDPGGSAGPRPALGPPTLVPAAARRYGSILVLDVGTGGGRSGVMILARREAVAFSREEALLAEILASQIAIQIERARRSNEARLAGEKLQQKVDAATRDLQERNTQLAVLNAIAAAAGPALDADKQCDAALREALHATRHAVGALRLLEPGLGGEDGAGLRFVRGAGEAGYLDLARGVDDDAYPFRAWKEDRAIVVPDLWAERDDAVCEALHRAGYRALVCVPLHARGRVLGTLEMLAVETRNYPPEEVALAQAIGDQIAVVLQNSRLLSEVMAYSLELEARLERTARGAERREERAAALQSVAQAAARSTDARELCEATLPALLATLGFEAGAVHLADPGTRTLRLRAQHGFPDEALDTLAAPRPGRSLPARAFETGETVVAAPDDADPAEGSGPRFVAAAPLRAPGSVHGVLSLAARDGRVPDRDETAFLAAVASLLGMAVENSRAFRAPDAPAGPETETRLADRLAQAQKLEWVGTLAGGIAHDFNNILGAILGYATHIRSLVGDDNPIHRHAGIIEQQSVRAAELTRQLLAFARGGQYTLEPIDMNQVVADTTSLLSKSLDPRITIEMKRDAGLPAVEADAGQMTQIVLNAAVNAAEAMPEGGRITFETRLSRLDEAYARANPGVRSGEYVEVVVADTGAGMTSEIADRAFEPFFTTKPAGKGTGLGLSVVYGIVKNHRGHVQLTSTKGLGTTVRLYLPVSAHRAAQETPSDPAPRSSAAADMTPARTTPVEAPPSATAPPSPASAAQQATARPAPIPETPGPAAGPRPNAASPAPPAAVVPGSAGRILVVDDEDAIRQLARDILESRGFDVVLANDGVDALEKYRAHWGTIDLVLLDMVMPKMGGLETFRRLLGIDRALRVVLCSGFAENEHSQQAIREGALGLLSKPFTMAELMARVQKCLRRDGARPAR